MTQSDAPVRAYSPTDDASIGELVSRMSEQVSRLVHDEMALAQAEAKQKAKNLGLGIGLFGTSGVLAWFGLMSGVAAAIFGLATAMSAWLAALTVALVLFVLAGAAALIGKRDVQKGSPPVPTEAVQSTKQDVAAVRQAVKQ